MAVNRVTALARAVLLVCVFASPICCGADDPLRPAVIDDSLTDQAKQDINRWVVDLDHDEYRLRARAQEALEKLTGGQLRYAQQQLTEKLSLEYMTRRERILKAFGLTVQLERVADEMREAKKTGTCETPGLAAYCRIVKTDLAATRTFFELDRECENYLITVYAAPRYAQRAVRDEIKTVVRSGNRSDWQTDTMALKWISVFLTLCDKQVQLSDREISSELRILTSSLQTLSIEFALQDRQHGSILRELIEAFIQSAGERGDDFAKMHRVSLANKLQLSK